MPLGYPYNLKPLKHLPVRPPREGYAAETIYSQVWSALMLDSVDAEYPNEALDAIMREGSLAVDQRCATVAASFICWLGTNVGKIFIDKAHALQAVMAPSEAFLAAWSVHNRRVSHMNGGNRSIELMLDLKSPSKPDPLHRCSAVDELDYETVEHLLVWLGTEEGAGFIADCEQKVVVAKKKTDLRHHLEANLGLSEKDVNLVFERFDDFSPNSSVAP